ncbi:MAG: class I SAM-dependent methyltransferase [Saprospiraceae bacterium]
MSFQLSKRKNNLITMRLLYVFLCSLPVTVLSAQQGQALMKPSLQQSVLAAYEREAQAMQHLSQIREQIRQRMPNPEILSTFDDFFSGLVKKDRTVQSLSEELKTIIKSVIPLDSLTRAVANWQRLKLQSLRLIQQKLTPEQLTNAHFQDSSMLWQYWDFFNIQPKESVAELGAGSGWLSLLLCILYNDVEIYVNELGKYSLQQARYNIASELTPAQLAHCHFIEGSKNSTGLEMENLDLIIAVDAFHHFSDKISMLQSIKWSLAKGGRFCLVEQVKRINTDDDYCPQALEKWELEALLQQNGFIKNKERLLVSSKAHNIYLLEYIINPL